MCYILRGYSESPLENSKGEQVWKQGAQLGIAIIQEEVMVGRNGQDSGSFQKTELIGCVDILDMGEGERED